MGWVVLILAGVVVVAMSDKARAGILSALSMSATAIDLGLDNTPTGDDATRLLHTAGYMQPILAILWAGGFDSAHVTSAYRSEEVNAAIGGSQTSRHRYGLAMDFGGIGTWEGPRAAARHLRQHAAEVGIVLRTVIAEDDHVHVDLFDPLGLLAESRSSCLWLMEKPSGSPRFVALV